MTSDEHSNTTDAERDHGTVLRFAPRPKVIATQVKTDMGLNPASGPSAQAPVEGDDDPGPTAA